MIHECFTWDVPLSMETNGSLQSGCEFARTFKIRKFNRHIIFLRYSNDQMWMHRSATTEGDNFPIFNNSQTFRDDFSLVYDVYE